MTASSVTLFSLSNFSSAYLLEIVVGILIIIGIVRGLRGRRYSPLRALRTPMIYILFTLFAIFLSSIPNVYAQYMILLLPVGIPIGYRFGRDVKFFTRDNTLYYTRSPYILLIWAIALIARVSLEMSSFRSLLAIIIFNALLSFVTGMLLGEAIHILSTHSKGKVQSTIASSSFNSK